MQLLTGIAMNAKEFINVVVFNVDASVLWGSADKDVEVQAERDNLKTEIGSKKLPVFKYYKNVKTGAEKQKSSYELLIPSDADLTTPEGISKVSATLIDEMKSGIEHSVKDIME